MVLVFQHLLALGNGCSKSFDARHVRRVIWRAIAIARLLALSQLVAADIQTRQRPDGGNTIQKGRKWVIICNNLVCGLRH